VKEQKIQISKRKAKRMLDNLEKIKHKKSSSSGSSVTPPAAAPHLSQTSLEYLEKIKQKSSSSESSATPPSTSQPSRAPETPNPAATKLQASSEAGQGIEGNSPFGFINTPTQSSPPAAPAARPPQQQTPPAFDPFGVPRPAGQISNPFTKLDPLAKLQGGSTKLRGKRLRKQPKKKSLRKTKKKSLRKTKKKSLRKTKKNRKLYKSTKKPRRTIKKSVKKKKSRKRTNYKF